MAIYVPVDEAKSILKKSVPELKAELGNRSLSKSGTKAELQDRLLDAFASPKDADTKSLAGYVVVDQAKQVLKMSVSELKAELGKQSLSKSGTKSELQDRLLDTFSSQESAPINTKKRKRNQDDSKEDRKKNKSDSAEADELVETETKEIKSIENDTKKTTTGSGLASYLTDKSWQTALASELSKDYVSKIVDFVAKERKNAGVPIYPPDEDVFTALNTTPFHNVKVVILGQDPYHGKGQGHGLSFSVRKGIKVPPSLNRIYKELATDIPGFKAPKHGYLLEWAQRGVLLLNAILTVREAKPNSHKSCGWAKFTDSIISTLNEKGDGIVFLLWGGEAHKKGAHINKGKHHVICTAHPSPMAATGFIGSRCFSKANTYLKSKGKEPINWSLTP